MIDYGIVKCSIKPTEKVIDDYSVWINSNIKEVATVVDELVVTEYEFNQIKYDKNEYIAIIDNKNSELENSLVEVQLALCEIYEMNL